MGLKFKDVEKWGDSVGKALLSITIAFRDFSRHFSIIGGVVALSMVDIGLTGLVFTYLFGGMGNVGNMISWGVAISFSALSIWLWGVIREKKTPGNHWTVVSLSLVALVVFIQVLDMFVSVAIMEYIPGGTGDPQLFMADGNRSHTLVWWAVLIALAILEFFGEWLVDALLGKLPSGSKKKVPAKSKTAAKQPSRPMSKQGIPTPNLTAGAGPMPTRPSPASSKARTVGQRHAAARTK